MAEQFQPYEEQGQIPARVTACWSWQYEIATDEEVARAEISGKLRHNALYAARRPVTGDWVAVQKADSEKYIINAVLPRSSCLQRQQVNDNPEAQAIAANIDVCLIIQALAGDYNLARLDRYIALAINAGATPHIVLTKADLVPEADELAKAVQNHHPGVKIDVVSAVSGAGVDQLRQQLNPGRTYVAIGSSGVGKSTLLNVLAAEELMKTASVREEDHRGRHTTTHRQLSVLPGGALYIDTPGIRELELFAPGGLTGTFQDIETLAAACKFRDCTHENEPGCAVRRALESGELTQERLSNYHKLLQEEGMFHKKQIRLNKKVSKTRIKRRGVHYKDYVRGGTDKDWLGDI